MRVLLIRPNRNELDAVQIKALGFEPVIDPYLRIDRVENPAGVARMLSALKTPTRKWFVNSSLNAFDNFNAQLPKGAFAALDPTAIRFAAIGPSTREQLQANGVVEVVTAVDTTGQSLAETMLELEKMPLVIPSGNIPMRALPNQFEALGLPVMAEIVYQTSPVTERPASAALVDKGEIDAVVFRSPSAVRAFLALHPKPRLNLICLGPTTATELRRHSLKPAVIAPRGDLLAALADLSERIRP